MFLPPEPRGTAILVACCGEKDSAAIALLQIWGCFSRDQAESA